MELPWTQARTYVRAAYVERTRGLVEMATALRASGMDAKSWEQWIKSVSAD